MHKVLVIVPFALDESGMANRESQMKDVQLGPDISFDFRGVKAGPALLDSYHDSALADVALFEAGKTAQDEGYAAVCIDTMSDSGVNPLRSVLDIPVIGPGRASYPTALMLGDRFSVLTQWDPWMALYKKGLRECGLEDKCASIRSINTPPDVSNLLGGKEEVVFPKLKAAAEAVHRGRRRGDLHGLDDDAPGGAVPAREPSRAGHQPRPADLQAGGVLHRPRALAEPQGVSPAARAEARHARGDDRRAPRPPEASGA